MLLQFGGKNAKHFPSMSSVLHTLTDAGWHAGDERPPHHRAAGARSPPSSSPACLGDCLLWLDARRQPTQRKGQSHARVSTQTRRRGGQRQSPELALVSVNTSARLSVQRCNTHTAPGPQVTDTLSFLQMAR